MLARARRPLARAYSTTRVAVEDTFEPMRRWVAAIVALGGTWILACQRSVDGPTVAPILVWIALAAVFRATLPPGRVTTARLAAALLAIDLVFDLANPEHGVVLRPAFEIGRVAALFAIDALLARYAPSRRLALVWIAFGLRGITLALVGVAAAVGVWLLVDGGHEDAIEDADAILVLGYALRPDGAPTPSLVARVDRAAEAASRAPKAVLVVSGWTSAPGVTEAAVMRDLLVRRGVDPARIVLEPEARTTVENFVCAAPILRARGASRVALVTERWHMTRSSLLATRYAPGFVFLRAPAPAPSSRMSAFRAVREAGGIVAEIVSPTVPHATCTSR